MPPKLDDPLKKQLKTTIEDEYEGSRGTDIVSITMNAVQNLVSTPLPIGEEFVTLQFHIPI